MPPKKQVKPAEKFIEVPIPSAPIIPEPEIDNTTIAPDSFTYTQSLSVFVGTPPASELWCPFAMVSEISYGGHNRTITGRPHQGCFCISDKCMAWSNGCLLIRGCK